MLAKSQGMNLTLKDSWWLPMEKKAKEAANPC